MADLRLVIGNRNYSSWSLRAWLALQKSGVSFETVLLPLDTTEFAEQIGQYSPSGRVPVLWHGEHCIWDSLAIGEYVNEQLAQGRLWPQAPASRALGRSMSAEMHSSFPHLRNAMPMNIRARDRLVPMERGLKRDIERIWTLWDDALSRNRDTGPWLLGNYSLADAMFAPVVFRFQTYGVEVPDTLRPYCQQVVNDADLAPWIAAALEETWIVAADEAGESSA
ncbi:glutathione S-transferase family protein [Halieaceae bacterium]|nr:glutathione S-transferase family protein [Halieaceae bacterium]